jgi:hypothetical protein
MATPNFSSGTGNAAEALMDVNPTITIPAGGRLKIWNFIATYEGIGTIRLRETNLAGAELLRIRFAADGLIQGDFRSSPIEFLAPRGSDRVIAITQEGAFSNSLMIAGD